MFVAKRVYEPATKDDGYRVLVDRLWPRGLTKTQAHVDLWLKEVSPSAELRNWFKHDPEKWPEFQKRYRAEMKMRPEALATLRTLGRKHKKVTLLYGAKSEGQNQAVALLKVLASGKKG